MIVFDLDGCLIDSRELVRQSYREAGAEAPADFFALGHHDWIPCVDREAVHARKDAAYLRHLAADTLEFLPPWQTAEMLHDAGHPVALLSNAPDGAARALAMRVSAWPFQLWAAGVRPAAKGAWLSHAGTGVYVDDQRHVTVPPGWRFVHYVGQSATELYGQVT